MIAALVFAQHERDQRGDSFVSLDRMPKRAIGSDLVAIPATMANPLDVSCLFQVGDVLRLAGVRRTLAEGGELLVENVTRQHQFQVRHNMSPRQVQFLLRGGLINWMKERLSCSPESRAP